MLIENVDFFTSFETLCGFVKFKNEQAFNDADIGTIGEKLKMNVSFSDDEFENLKETLMTKFLASYHGEKIATQAQSDED